MTLTVGRRDLIGNRVEIVTPDYSGPVHVREDGPSSAPVLVLLHGLSGSMHWFDMVVPLLVDSYRIVRVDLLGHGSTGGPAADAPAQARMVAAVLEALDLDAVTVMGHSFGADVAVELNEKSPRVDRLVIVAQAPDYSDATLPGASSLMRVPGLRTAAPRLVQGIAGLIGPHLIERRVPPAGRGLAVQALSDFRALDPRMFRVAVVDRGERMARRPLDAQVRDAGKPALVILGENDHFYGARSKARYEAAGAEVHVFAGCGHSPCGEMPEQTVALIRRFVAAAD